MLTSGNLLNLSGYQHSLLGRRSLEQVMLQMLLFQHPMFTVGQVELCHLSQREQHRSKAHGWELEMKAQQEMTEGITFQNEGSNMGSGRK